MKENGYYLEEVLPGVWMMITEATRWELSRQKLPELPEPAPMLEESESKVERIDEV